MVIFFNRIGRDLKGGCGRENQKSNSTYTNVYLLIPHTNYKWCNYNYRPTWNKSYVYDNFQSNPEYFSYSNHKIGSLLFRLQI